MTFQSANVPAVDRRQVLFLLYTGRNNSISIPDRQDDISNIEGYAVWKNGVDGRPVIRVTPIYFASANNTTFGFLASVLYAHGARINEVDRWTFTYGGDDYIVNISDANILTAFSRTHLTIVTPASLYATFPTGDLISARVLNELTVTLFTPRDNLLYNIWWTDIEGVVSTDLPNLPIEMNDTSNTFTFDGTLHPTIIQKVSYSLARRSGFAKYKITLDVLEFVPEDPVLPPPVTEISYTLLITSIRLDGDVLKGYLSIVPPLPSDFNRNVEILYQQTQPNRLPIAVTLLNWTGDGEYDLLTVLAGQHFTFYLKTTFAIPYRLLVSPTYNYMRVGETVIPDTTVTQEAELSDSKIYLDRLGATSLSLLIINDLFNTDDVSKVVIGITNSLGTSIQEKANTVFDARIEIDITGLSQETDYSLEVQIEYNSVAKTIATLKVTTLKSLTSGSSDAEKQAYTRKNFTRRNYDKEDVDLIENLPITQWDAVVTNSIRQMNDAESDQLPHDLNRFNRRGSVHNAPRSPSPTGNFVGLLSVRIAEESGAIPDIDEGYA